MAPRKTARTGPAEGGHADGRERVLEFRFSKQTVQAIDEAMRGLDAGQQDRVWAAIDGITDEVGDKVARAIERNVIGNANELLEALTHALAGGNRWDDLRAIWGFLEHLDVPVNHPRIARSLEKSHGVRLAARYRKAAAARAPQATGDARNVN